MTAIFASALRLFTWLDSEVENIDGLSDSKGFG